MKYNFDKLIDRTGTHSSKWDRRKEVFGREDILPLWVADMDFACAQPIVEALKKRASHKNYGYTAYPPEFYSSIVNWMKKHHNWNIERNWINTTPGVIPALSLAIREFSSPGDKVVVQPPTYYPFYEVIKNNGRRVVYNKLKLDDGKYFMDFENLNEVLDDERVKLLILCSPHNPVGRVWTEKELTKLGELCLKHNVMVISDEIHSDHVYEEATHTPFASISEEFAQNSITCNSCSKTFNLSGLKTAYVVIPEPSNFNRFENMLSNIWIGSCNLFGIEALIAAYQEGEEWYNQLMEYLEQNREYVLDYFKEDIPKIEAFKPEGTYLVWLDCRDLGLNQEELNNFMINEARVGLVDGTKFSPGGKGFLRMNIGCPQRMLEKALKRIENAVDNLS